MSAQECFICRKHRGEIPMLGSVIYQDDWFLVCHSGMPDAGENIYLGYLIVESKRHIPGLADLSGEEAAAFGTLMARLSKALQVTENAAHVYAFVIGDRVPHLHLHLIPRYPNAPPDYYGVHVDEWPDAPRGGLPEIKVLCDRLGAYLARQNIDDF